MWKWTDNDNIKAVILDIDSIDSEYVSYPFDADIPDIHIIEVSQHSNNPLNGHFHIEYYDITELLYQIMKEYSLNSSQIVAISADTFFLKEMMQYHIGTVFVGNLDKEQLRYTPDYTNKNLKKIFSKRNQGYGAEVIATQHSKIKRRVLLKCNSNVELSNGEIQNIQLYFGGRYYSNSREYILDDPLSTVLLDFKNKYNKMVDEYYDGALNLLNSITPIDILTYVPMKPKDIRENKFDRFNSLKLNKINKQGIHLTNIINCNKDFSQKHNDAYHRKENVRNAYTLKEDVRGKTVAVLDDLYVTGSTITEIARILYENGAVNVIAVFLAVNQMTESPAHPYKQIKCQKCNGHMVLKVSRVNNLFFGCSNYPICHFSMDKDEGLKLLNKINQISIDDIYDLEDIY